MHRYFKAHEQNKLLMANVQNEILQNNSDAKGLMYSRCTEPAVLIARCCVQQISAEWEAHRREPLGRGKKKELHNVMTFLYGQRSRDDGSWLSARESRQQ